MPESFELLPGQLQVGSEDGKVRWIPEGGQEVEEDLSSWTEAGKVRTRLLVFFSGLAE